MKFKNKNIQVGQIVRVIEKYNEAYHNIKKDREYVGFVTLAADSGGNNQIMVRTKKLIGKILPASKFRDMFRLIGETNFGCMGEKSFFEDDISVIEILKEVKE